VFTRGPQRCVWHAGAIALEARKSAILESALDCWITMDHQGRVVEFNPAVDVGGLPRPGRWRPRRRWPGWPRRRLQRRRPRRPRSSLSCATYQQRSGLRPGLAGAPQKPHYSGWPASRRAMVLIWPSFAGSKCVPPKTRWIGLLVAVLAASTIFSMVG